METEEFIEKSLDTKPKFIQFLAFWIINYCNKHELNILDFIFDFIHHLKSTQHEQQQKSVELDTTTSSEEI